MKKALFFVSVILCNNYLIPLQGTLSALIQQPGLKRLLLKTHLFNNPEIARLLIKAKQENARRQIVVYYPLHCETNDLTDSLRNNGISFFRPVSLTYRGTEVLFQHKKDEKSIYTHVLAADNLDKNLYSDCKIITDSQELEEVIQGAHDIWKCF
jgi:hypothetical protein